MVANQLCKNGDLLCSICINSDPVYIVSRRDLLFFIMQNKCKIRCCKTKSWSSKRPEMFMQMIISLLYSMLCV